MSGTPSSLHGSMAEVDVRIEAGPAAASAAREAIEAVRAELDHDKELLHDVRLLVTELVTNSVRHGRAGPDGLVHLRIKVTRRKVRVEVRDRGPGFDSRKPQPAEDRASGWGLFFVDRMADRWGVDRRRGTLVWFELDR